MLNVLQIYPRLLDRFVCVVSLAGTFYLCCTIMSVELGNTLLLQVLAYATIISNFIDLSRRTINSCYQSMGSNSHLVVGNAIGILISSCIMLLLGILFSDHSVFTPVIIVSGIMAFFLLSVLCPLVHEVSSSIVIKPSAPMDPKQLWAKHIDR